MKHLAILMFLLLGAQLFGGDSKTKKTTNNSLQAKAANCAPATSRMTLQENNVSALIETGGIMWQDRSTNSPAYEVPVGSNEFYLYSGALWMGGLDVNGQLKLAAQKFAQDGRDYWTGPLSTIPNTGNISIGTLDYGPAEIEPDVCEEYDKFFHITKAQVAEFKAWYDCTQDPNCNENDNFPGYSIPKEILNWPAHGDVGRFQDYYLAPFYDHPNSVQGVYDPLNGDYPWYDLNKEVDCRTSRKVTLYGDFTTWWIFNDKGNIHTESGGDPIGMEVRAQAFGFNTNDEINNMTFYNYELVNRSTQRLTETYFAVYADPDIGFAENDYVGCDVSRGVGYAYNATANDIGGNNNIGLNPGAIGIDFFEGPYQDNDGIDNPLANTTQEAIDNNGIPYSGLGIGYGDGTVDSERLGMRTFSYFTNGAAGWGTDPASGTPVQFYNYMKAIWVDNTQFTYGGQGHLSGTPTNYVFPGDSDPKDWGTGAQGGSGNWTEQSAGNFPGDRRFVQSAGPFTLEPGALNNITVGVVYGRGDGGDPFESVRAMLKADDKAQLLFDNCFRLIDGPNAPNLAAQELDREVILYLENPSSSNNNVSEDEDYSELDNNILPMSVSTVTDYVYDNTTNQYVQEITYDTSVYDQYYRFQGYQIYQVKNATVGPESIGNTDLARIVAQCDKKDDVGDLINYEYDAALDVSVPVLKVSAANNGIKHAFQIKEDEFALGDKRLINHKKYYYLAIAYGHNNFKTYHPSDAPDGQSKPYLPSRNSASGIAIQPITVIPHIPDPELGGTIHHVQFGDGPELTRIEGSGTGFQSELAFTLESEQKIINDFTPIEVTYKAGKGPVDIRIVDPLNVKPGDYTLKFSPSSDIDQSNWVIYRSYMGEIDSIISEKSINEEYEQIIKDWGIAIQIQQPKYDTVKTFLKSEYVTSSISFDDTSQIWLTGIKDTDQSNNLDWIASGTTNEEANSNPTCLDLGFWNDNILGITSNEPEPIDANEEYESILEGTWAPFKLVREGSCYDMPISDPQSIGKGIQDLIQVHSVDVVYTSDKSKWTRVPVLEAGDLYGVVEKGNVKNLPSRDKNGLVAGDPGYNSYDGDRNGAQPTGMSWFPGYAIDMETGERLNMAFSEDSWYSVDNGRDMIFNPSSRIYDAGGDHVLGGKHNVFIFKNRLREVSPTIFDNQSEMPAYDEGNYLYDRLVENTSISNNIKVWRACSWVGTNLTLDESKTLDPSDPFGYILTDARISIRVRKKYTRHSDNAFSVNNQNNEANSQNNWFPMYTFSMNEIQTLTDNADMADSALNLINVVPNPYYAYSNYEFNRLDNIVKITNLPDVCNIRIYNVSGTLVKTFEKDSPITSVDWLLTNDQGIPIASGMYLIHIDVPGVGERVLKWFGVVRSVDLENF